jgi:hypothetical protein
MRALIIVLAIGCAEERDSFEIATDINADRTNCAFGEWPTGPNYESRDCARVCTPKPASVLPLPPGMSCPFGMFPDAGGRVVIIKGLVGVCIQELKRLPSGDYGALVNWSLCYCDVDGKKVECRE